MKCPYCGGVEIVWRYNEGYVVCSSCGTVIDKIYDYTCKTYGNDSSALQYKLTLSKLHEDFNIKLRSIKWALIDIRYRRFKRKLKVFPKLRPGLKIREEVLEAIYNGKEVKLVKTIVNELTEEVKSKLSESEETRIYLDLLEIFKVYPKISSRTDRVKLALAKIVYNEIVYGFRPSFASVAREFHVSVVNLRKAYKELQKYSEIYVKARNLVMSRKNHGKKTFRNKKIAQQIALGSKI